MAEHGRIVDGLDEPEMSGGIPMPVQMKLIDLRCDAADRHSIPVSGPEFSLCMLKERIVLRLKMKFSFKQERGYPVWIVPVNPIWKSMEIAPILARLHLPDIDRSRFFCDIQHQMFSKPEIKIPMGGHPYMNCRGTGQIATAVALRGMHCAEY